MARKEEPLTFHNEGALTLIARGAKIVGWAILVIYLLSFVNELKQTIPNLSQMPTDLMTRLLIFANMFFPIAMGAFYFLMLQGLAQGLYVALDLFISTEEVEEEEGIVL
ncbi:MAG: hypothetical protein HFACDABA_03231 [Anaerolineales bacterium]|nr:hypothetical protein [Anaerolineales bacterium]